MNQSAERINEVLAGFTDVEELSLGPRGFRERYDLQIVLTDSHGDGVVLKCANVSGLRIADFVGGLSQFLCLRAKDQRVRQLDRIKFHFVDEERKSIEFDCEAAEIEIRS
jgi:hypothetical protein